MEMTGLQNLHIPRQFTNSQSVIMATQLLLSVSVFSIFFSHSSFLSFLNSINFCFSTFPYQLFTHTIDKNCIFLICNGLLVFLAKYSASLSSQQDESHSKNIKDGFKSELSMSQNNELMFLEKEVEVRESTGSAVDVVKEGNEEEYSFTNQIETEVEKDETIIEGKEQEQGSGTTASEEEEDDHDDEETSSEHVAEEEAENNLSNDGFLAEQASSEEEEEDDDEEEEEEGNGMLSTEELNKKFDEFIRRMKEELRIEAQRQLIMAV